MGMYDHVICRVPLPETPPSFIKPDHLFQSKSLDCFLETYEITQDGLLPLKDFSGEIEFYTNNIAGSCGGCLYTKNGEDAESVDYLAKFSNGKLTELTQTLITIEPALPSKNMRFHQPTREEMKRHDTRRTESLLGRTMYQLWGGQKEGSSVKVVNENDKEWVVQHPDGSFEVAGRHSRDRTLFDNKEDAIAYRLSRENNWNEQKKEYDDYRATWKPKRI